MRKKRKRSVPVAPPKQEKKMVIDMNAMNLKKEHAVPGFRTGRHMTEKDRPRKKDWKREYYKSKEPGRYNSDTNTGSFVVILYLLGCFVCSVYAVFLCCGAFFHISTN